MSLGKGTIVDVLFSGGPAHMLLDKHPRGPLSKAATEGRA
jgi:hypothetical protein